MHCRIVRRSQFLPLSKPISSREGPSLVLRSRQRCSSTCRVYSTTSTVEHAMPVELTHPAKKTRIKKAFSDLPKTFTAPDGSAASPLGPWLGGLSSLNSRSASFTEDAADPVESVSVKSANDILSPKKRKRRVTRPAETADEQGSKKSRKKSGASKLSEETVEAAPDTPLSREILNNLSRFPHCILLTRVGQFYESYFDKAAEVAKLLSIKLTSKSWGRGRVPMCGFPIAHLNKYLKVLVQDNHRFVALCEEFLRSPELGPKGGFDRRVARIVTPGTLIDEPFLNQYENNYLLAISAEDPAAYPEGNLGLAWIDMSTGDFFTKNVDREVLQDELARISPKEIVLAKDAQDTMSQSLLQATADDGYFVSFAERSLLTTDASDATLADNHAGVDDLTTPTKMLKTDSAMTLTSGETGAVNLLTAFLSANLVEGILQQSTPSREAVAGRMQIDSHTIKALELKESIREGGTAGSLLSVIKRTVTSGGTRLLSRWLCSPSASITEINARQSLVAFFHSRPHLRADLVQSLSQLEDATRIVQKFLLGRGQPTDLVAVCSTIRIWCTIRNRLQLEREMEAQERGALVHDEWTSVEIVLEKMHSLHELVSRIQAAIVCDIDSQDDTVNELTDENNEQSLTLSSSSSKVITAPFNWAIRPEFSEELAKLHKELEKCVKAKDKMERRLQAELRAPSLTLRSSPGQGMHVHIARAKRDAAQIKHDPSFVPISQRGNTRAYFYKEWSQLGNRMIELAANILTTERAAFELLRQDVIAHTPQIRSNSRIMDELDVAIAYANLAAEMNLTRPVITEDTSYHVEEGRHPTVELGLLASGRVFHPNTVSFTPESPLHIITGPNMAGKSTLLRQTALIAILAQTGSFVPADYARIGVTDKIFSRVGAKDDLFRARSTFMVEMLETADILRRATPNSLVIMDEVGRGTTTEDGLAIAFAAVHHLLCKNGCRTLFATHFHELADLLGYTSDHRGQGAFAGVSFFCTDIDESQDGYFSYSHRLRPGVNRDSHGLRVAQLAGMPESAIQVARGAFDWLRQRRNAVTEQNKNSLQSLGQVLAQQSGE